MRDETSTVHPRIRRLWASDTPSLVDHFQRLDRKTRRLRFCGAVSNRFTREYAEDIPRIDSVIFGAFPDKTLRGVAELHGIFGHWPRSGEVALLVEPAWQAAGIGEALFTRLIAAAQNRGISTLYMFCLRENARMRNLARKHNASLVIDAGTIEAKLAPPWPTPISILEEFASVPYNPFLGSADPPE